MRVSRGDWQAKLWKGTAQHGKRAMQVPQLTVGTCCSGSMRRKSEDAYLCSRVKQLHRRHADGLWEL